MADNRKAMRVILGWILKEVLNKSYGFKERKII